MESNFWQTLAHPIIGLSPMDGVTDHPFRFIHKKYGKASLMMTEFTSTEGLCHGAEKLLKEFIYDETQRPIIGQIYGTSPEYFRQATVMLCELGFDGIDINMGCPAKNVAHSGAGAALIKTPKLAQEIIAATKQGVIDWTNGVTVTDCPNLTENIRSIVKEKNSQLPEEYKQKKPVPVSVKTRVGFDYPVIEEWIPNLLEMEPAAITVHGRTLKQQYSGLADWDEIGKAAQLAKASNTPLLGNGDIQSLVDAEQKIKTYDLQGALIGRAAFGNPLIFNPGNADNYNIFNIALEHSRLFEDTFKDNYHYNFLPMRKHLGWYVKSIPKAKEVRQRIFQTNNAIEVEALFREYELMG